MNRFLYFLSAVFFIFLAVVIYPKNLLDNVVNFSITIQEGAGGEVEEVGEVTYGGGAFSLGVKSNEVTESEEILSGEDEVDYFVDDSTQEVEELTSDLKDATVVGGFQYGGSDETYIYNAFGDFDLFPKEITSVSQSDDGLISSSQDSQVTSSYEDFYMEWVNLEPVNYNSVLFTYEYDRDLAVDPLVVIKKRLLYSVTGAGCGVFSFSILLSLIQGVSFKQVFVGLIRFLR